MSFQSTHPCGVRQERSLSADELSRFNPRTPAGCDYYLLNVEPNPNQFQSTHPCGVRPGLLPGGNAGPGVSIHAPLRGATRLLCTGHHTVGGFNPRTPAGCDPGLCALLWDGPRFQSTHPCGVRLALPIMILVSAATFQSTHPCGVRHWSASFLRNFYCCFNPRTPAGCDP